MEWKPNKLVAVLLGLFTQSIAMLYLGRVKWAVFYFVVLLLVVSVEFLLSAPWLSYASFSAVVAVVCAVHAYRIAACSTAIIDRPWYSKWFGLAGIFAVYLVAIFVIRAFFYEPFRMPSASMHPSINAGKYIIVKKYGYGNYGTFGVTVSTAHLSEEIERGDLLVFKYPPDPSISFVKRVIGLPGEVVAYKDRQLSINGETILTEAISQDSNGKNANNTQFRYMRETYKQAAYNVAYIHDRVSQSFEVTVPADSYFVLGDNRDNSRDSRYWGFVDNQSIIGKVVFVTH